MDIWAGITQDHYQLVSIITLGPSLHHTTQEDIPLLENENRQYLHFLDRIFVKFVQIINHFTSTQ